MSAVQAAAHPLLPEARALRARDFAGLLAALLLAAAPHALRAPGWLVLLTLALYAWRGAALANHWEPPPRAFALLVAAAALAGIWLEYHHIFGRVPGIVLLVLLSGLKLLEARTHRDAAVVAFLSCFLVMTNFLYTQSIASALLMLAVLWAVTVTLVGCNAPGRPLRADLRNAGLLLAQAAPAALALFLLFPRVQGPMWGLPQDSRTGVTGLSDTMSPGNVARLAQSDALAFRADFAGSIPAARQRYWRGPVLWDFDGRTWRAGEPLLRRSLPPTPEGGRTYRYVMTLEPQQNRWIPALETPVRRPPGAGFTFDRQLIAVRPVRSRERYDMVSVADGHLDPAEYPALLRRALELPPHSNPRAAELAERWRRQSPDAAGILARAIAFYRDARFDYTLEPLPLGEDAVDDFLFTTRSGFCEHFASSFAFLMRAAGLPARVVTGYLGGDPNPLDGILTVRQSDAHAWVEVYLKGRGWVRVDPTAAAVPARLDLGLARAVSRQGALPLLMRPQFEWLRSLRYRWDALVYQWNLRVLGYDPDRQREFMSWLGVPHAGWEDLVVALCAALALIGLSLLAWSLRRIERPDAVQRAWREFCGKLARYGVERAPHEGPSDYTERAAGRAPAAGAAIRGIGALYVELRYGPVRPAAEVQELARRVRALTLA